MNLDPIDFIPGYTGCLMCARRRQRESVYSAILTHLLVIFLTIALCGTAYYVYNQSEFIERAFMKDNMRNSEEKDMPLLNDMKIKMEVLQEEIDKTKIWRKHLDELFTNIYLQQDNIFNKKIDQALEIYDADKTGLYDYASLYAYGSIISIPNTEPYPANKTITFFKFLNVDLLSEPEALLQPNNLPGNCFAFHGDVGRIRIKLGKKIRIHAVTLDHIKLLEDMSSAPKDFEVFGLHDPEDETGVLLGRFTYNLNGKPYQTFRTNSNLTLFSFEYVELRVLSNYGRKEFTCVYRFRVHNRFTMKQKLCKSCHN